MALLKYEIKASGGQASVLTSVLSDLCVSISFSFFYLFFGTSWLWSLQHEAFDRKGFTWGLPGDSVGNSVYCTGETSHPGKWLTGIQFRNWFERQMRQSYSTKINFCLVGLTQRIKKPKKLDSYNSKIELKQTLKQNLTKTKTRMLQQNSDAAFEYSRAGIFFSIFGCSR